MTEPDEIANVFGIFHDGTIAGGSNSGSAAELLVEIECLAERVRQDYRRFTICLSDLTVVRFVPWTDAGADSIADITDFSEIVGLDLGVLSADSMGSTVRVACTQKRSGYGYSGGFLEIAAGGCQVRDEGGSEWALDALRKLSDAYWSDWAARSKNTDHRSPITANRSPLTDHTN